MIDEFKNEMFGFIYMGGIKFPTPAVINVTFDDQGGATHHYPVISLAPQAPLRFFLKHTLIHSLLDAVFESENPRLENKGYVSKYKSLPEGNDYEMAVKETYRILTLLRNVITHNKSRLASNVGRLVCSYEKIGPKKQVIPIYLDASYDSLEILYSIALMRSKLKGSVDRYHQLMISAMYSTAVAQVAEFSDEYKASSGIGLKAVCLDRQIKWNRRYRVVSPEFAIHNDRIKFSKITVGEPWAGAEYVFTDGASSYVVPGEFLDEDGYIPMKDVLLWESVNKII